MALTRPQFSLPYTFTSDMTVELRFTDTTTTNLTLPSTGETRYNDRTGVVATDLLAWVADRINALDTDGTWSSEEVPGNILGRSRLKNTARTDGKTVDRITFGGAMQPEMLGYASSVVLVPDPTQIDGPFVRGRLYIPHSDSVEPIGMVDDVRDELTIVESVTPSANVTQDLYGTQTIRRIMITPVDAAFIKAHYAAQSDYLLTDMTVSDPNAPFDRFCAQWVSLSGDSKKCRYKADYADASYDYKELLPMASWLANVEVAAEILSEAPLLYQIDIECWEV